MATAQSLWGIMGRAAGLPPPPSLFIRVFLTHLHVHARLGPLSFLPPPLLVIGSRVS